MLTNRLPDKFEDKIVRVTEGGCWVWMASLDKHGYGQINLKGKVVRAHRHIFELLEGPVSPLLDLCHRCDNPPCVNPHHLFAGTRQQNMDDAKRKGRILGRPALMTCKYGHSKTGPNLYESGGRRLCRACRSRNDKIAHGRQIC